jgi:CBS domain-containing protein
MIVEELMSPKVKSCLPDATLAEAARFMWDNDCGCVPVVDAGERVVGMLTDRDICMATYIQGKAPQEIPVQGVMTRSIVSCGPLETIAAAESTMRRAQVRRLPVIDPIGRLVGVLSLNDIARRASDGRTPAAAIGITDLTLTLAAVCRPRETSEANGADA